MTPDQINLMASAFQVIRYEPGQLVFHQGQPTRGLMVFISGRGILTQRGADGLEDRIGMVETGQYINEASLYHEGLESASLRIVEQSIVLFLDRRQFLQLLVQNPEIRTNLRVTTALDSREAALKMFRGQREDESVLHIFRHHWWSFARHGWLALILAILLWIIAALLGAENLVFGLALGGLGIIIPGLLMLYMWYEWQNDYVIITDQRVVRIWRDVLRFESTINEIPLERILEINIDLPPADVFARLFGYGSIHIRTAGEAANIHLHIMPDPKLIQTMIFSQRDRYQDDVSQRNRENIRADIERAMGVGGVTPSQDAPETAKKSRGEIGLPFIRTRFVNQAGEIHYRRHATSWLGHVILPGLIILGSAVVGFLSLALPDFPLSGGAGLGVSFIMFLIGCLWFYMADWDWRNDLLIVGQQTITLIHKRPLWLQNQVERVRLSQVDNVISEVSGLFDNLLNRGTIRVSLIGSNEQKIFGKLYDPQEVQAEISRRQAQMKASLNQSDVQQQRQAIADYLAVYHQTVSGTQAAPPFNPPAPSQTNFDPGTQPAAYSPYSANTQPAEPSQQPTQPPPVRDTVRPPRVPRVRPPDSLPE